MNRYKLDKDRNVVPCDGILSERAVHVGDTTIGGVRVSTVFMGYGFGWPPYVFGGDRNGDGERYQTWDDAERGHERWCREVLASDGSDDV